MEEPFATFTIRSPEDAKVLAEAQIADEDREVFLVIMLNTKNQVIGLHRAHVGSINSSIVHPREVMKCAILNNAASIIVSHQHPSGNPHSKQGRYRVTKRLVEAGKIIGSGNARSYYCFIHREICELKRKRDTYKMDELRGIFPLLLLKREQRGDG